MIPQSWKENPPANVMLDALSGVLSNPYKEIMSTKEGPKIDWVICGGESGHGKRPFNVDWARYLQMQCNLFSVPFFMKQIDKIQPIPEDLMIRQFPTIQKK